MQGCICPHPPLLIPEVGGASLRQVSATVAAMRRLAAQVGEPETLVVISPHSDGYGDAHVVRTAPRLSGGLGRMDPILLEGAAECGLRSFMALGGFLGDDATVEPEILSYEGPFGVGYMVARFGAAEVERPGVEA